MRMFFRVLQSICLILQVFVLDASFRDRKRVRKEVPVAKESQQEVPFYLELGHKLVDLRQQYQDRFEQESSDLLRRFCDVCAIDESLLHTKVSHEAARVEQVRDYSYLEKIQLNLTRLAQAKESLSQAIESGQQVDQAASQELDQREQRIKNQIHLVVKLFKLHPSKVIGIQTEDAFFQGNADVLVSHTANTITLYPSWFDQDETTQALEVRMCFEHMKYHDAMYQRYMADMVKDAKDREASKRSLQQYMEFCGRRAFVSATLASTDISFYEAMMEKHSDYGDVHQHLLDEMSQGLGIKDWRKVPGFYRFNRMVLPPERGFVSILDRYPGIPTCIAVPLIVSDQQAKIAERDYLRAQNWPPRKR